jgi:hypothetical protein
VTVAAELDAALEDAFAHRPAMVKVLTDPELIWAPWTLEQLLPTAAARSQRSGRQPSGIGHRCRGTHVRAERERDAGHDLPRRTASD